MSDISALKKTIQTASRGEAVRDALVEALDQLNTSNEAALDAAEKSNASIYKLSIDGTTIKLTDANGNVQSVDVAQDTNTTYIVKLDGNNLVVTSSSGDVQTVDLSSIKTEDLNTTYTLGITDRKITLTDSNGEVQEIDLPASASASTTYILGVDGDYITLTDSSGAVQKAALPKGTTYTLTLNGRVLSLTDAEGNKQSVTLPASGDGSAPTIDDDGIVTVDGATIDENGIVTFPNVSQDDSGVVTPSGSSSGSGVTYNLSLTDNVLSLTASDGTKQSVTLPTSSSTDTDTTYSISIDGNVLTLTPSSGEKQNVTLPTQKDTNTTYTLSLTGNTLTLTSSDGEPQSVKLPSSSGGSSRESFQADETDPGGYIGMRIEGGGYIFFDYKLGFKSENITVPADEGPFKTYHVDPIRQIVVCENPTDTTKKDRFYVVEDHDTGAFMSGNRLIWGNTSNLSKLHDTKTGFGTGLANTKICMQAAQADNVLQWSAGSVIWLYMWKGCWQRNTDRGTNQWFLPSIDELTVLGDMQYGTATRTSADGTVKLIIMPIEFGGLHYYSSSEVNANTVHTHQFEVNNEKDTSAKNDQLANAFRCVRTF